MRTVCHGHRNASVSASSTTGAATAVPKILHQSWKSCTVPAKHRAWQEHCEHVLPPDWQMWLWTDDDNRELIATEFADFLPM